MIANQDEDPWEKHSPDLTGRETLTHAAKKNAALTVQRGKIAEAGVSTY